MFSIDLKERIFWQTNEPFPMKWIILLAIGFFCWIIVWLWNKVGQYRSFVKKCSQIPAIPHSGFPHPGWFLGNLESVFYFFSHLSRTKAQYQFVQMLSQYEDLRSQGILCVTVSWIRMILFIEQKSVEKLITSSVNVKKSQQYKFFESWLGTGLLTSHGDQWRRNRKFLTPAFHFKILGTFVSIMNQEIGKTIEQIERMIDQNPDRMQQEGVDIRPIVERYTLETICSTAMGVSIHSQDQYNSEEYVESLKTVMEKVIKRIFEPFYYFSVFFRLTPDGRENARSVNRIHRFVQKVIDDRKVEIEKLIQQQKIDLNKLASDDVEIISRKRYAFLDSLLLTHLKSPKEFTMKNILDEVNTFMFAGHDTTSTSLFFSLLLIATDQRVQDKLHEEMDLVFGSDKKRSITLEDCRLMNYLEMCIKESLRLYPSVVFIAREIVQEFTVGQYTVPVGCVGTIMISVLHRNPEIFPSPQRFIPERFEPDQPIHRMPYAYVPFSAGPRNCIGQKFAMLEMKIMLASILKSFKLKALVNIDDLDTDNCVILRCNSPIQIGFERRESSY